METLKLKKGSIVKINGVPLTLKKSVKAETHEGNLRLLQQQTPNVKYEENGWEKEGMSENKTKKLYRIRLGAEGSMAIEKGQHYHDVIAEDIEGVLIKMKKSHPDFKIVELVCIGEEDI